MKTKFAINIGYICIMVLLFFLLAVTSCNPSGISACQDGDSYERYRCVVKMAIIEFNGKYCNVLEQGLEKTNCVKAVQAFSWLSQPDRYEAFVNNLDMNNLSIQEALKHDVFYADFAVASGEVALCLLPESVDDRDKCYKQFALAMNDSEACVEITTDDRRDLCFINFAFQGNNETCSFINEDTLQNSCFSLASLINSNSVDNNGKLVLEEYNFNT
jgi:hypothetical protein